MSWKGIVGVWLLILPFMVVNGIMREVLLVPQLGRVLSDVVSAALGIVIILVVTRPLLRRGRSRSTGALARVSIVWVVLTVVFEFSFGHYVDGKSWAELVENYAIWRGKLWPLVLLSLAAAPFIWAGHRTVPRPDQST